MTVSTSITKRKEGIDMEKREREGSEAVEEGEGGVLIAVKDTGTGIDPELMPRLFTKFATKSYQGTGLGLFISKSIVEAHGGKMWAENNNDNDNNNNEDNPESETKHNGATFYFTLPVVNMNELRMGEEKEVRVIND